MTLAVGLALLLSGPALVSNAHAWRRDQSSTPGQEPTAPIRTSTNEVLVPVTVEDKRGELILDFPQNDFHVFDNGAEQPIDSCELGSGALAVALVIETSEHIDPMMPLIHKAGSVFGETVMGAGSEGAVITYDTDVEQRLPFTSDRYTVEKAVSLLATNGSQMHLYDGMYRALLGLETQPRNLRRVMLVIGESEDLGSHEATLGQVVREAVFNNVAIYVVGISSSNMDLRDGLNPAPIKLGKHAPQISSVKDPYVLDLMTPAFWLLTRGTNRLSSHQLEVAAAATGGIDYPTFKDLKIQEALDKIGGELHAQYLLSYKAPGGRVGDFHRIRVEVSRPRVAVRARPGYYSAVVGP